MEVMKEVVPTEVMEEVEVMKVVRLLFRWGGVTTAT